MSDEITLDDLIRILGEECIPPDVDRKILQKHFTIASNRIIGQKTVEKLKNVLESSIEAARAEKEKIGGAAPSSSVFVDSSLSVSTREKTAPSQKEYEDKYSLESIRPGLVSQRLKERDPSLRERESAKTDPPISEAVSPPSGLVSERLREREPAKTDPPISEVVSYLPSLPTDVERTEKITEESGQELKVLGSLSTDVDFQKILPSIDELRVLSGGPLEREVEKEEAAIKGKVQREIAIRDYSVKDEGRSARWGKEKVKNREAKDQEINHPAYIFHSDIWQLEAAREPSKTNRCDILQHIVLDMIANSINVVMLDSETEPFFVVEGYGLLQSKETLRDKIRVHELIQLLIISCNAWEIALKRPETLIKGREVGGGEAFHAIDMTSVIPLENIRKKMVEFDNEFKASYRNPQRVLSKTLRAFQDHRKNIIWSCGKAAINILRQAVKEHKTFIEKPVRSLNIAIIGTQNAFHPIKAQYTLGLNKLTYEELLPGYCNQSHHFPEAGLKTIFGSLPAIISSERAMAGGNGDITEIAHAVYQRIGYSALELLFDPGYIPGNPGEVLPISKLDIILPIDQPEMKQKLIKKGFEI